MLRPLACCLALPLLAACAEPDAAEYPRLMPLSELNQPPAIPAHATEAASAPAAVGAALDARRAEAAYCAEIAGLTYESMGLIAPGRPSSWYDPGVFWSGDDLPLERPWRLGTEIAVVP